MVWRWRDYAWGTSFTTTTPNEACGTPKTRKPQRGSAPPAGRRISEPTCRSTVCVRETCGSSLTAWTLPFFWNGLLSGTPPFRHRPLLYACLYEEIESKSELYKRAVYADRPESSLCLTDWTTVQREESYFCSPSLCPFFGAMFSDRLGKQLFFVWVWLCVCVGM